MAKGQPGVRQFMDRAVAVLHPSVAEPRPDGQASPLAGAVLVQRDGSIVAACR